jgi:biopolymer transport protein ExbD
MRIRDVQGEAEEPFNLVPLMDMAFNLLIFFMAATSFTQIEKDLRVQLPRVATTQSSAALPPKPLIINIKQDGSTTVAGKPYTPDELANYIQSQLKPEPKRAVLIRADERGLMKYFAQVALLCRRAGASELRIGMLQEPAPPTTR